MMKKKLTGFDKNNFFIGPLHGDALPETDSSKTFYPSGGRVPSTRLLAASLSEPIPAAT